MSFLLSRNIAKKAAWYQEAFQNLESYFQKTTFANRYRFRSRLNYKVITYPPTIDGNTDYSVSSKDETNEVIRRHLGIKRHPEEPLFPDEYSLSGPPKGKIYDKQPFKFKVEKGKAYSFCTCGYSTNQPFCDGTHKMYWTTHMVKRFPKYRPIKYMAEETKDVWFCNCKQSANLPFCDGTHKTDLVQSSSNIR